MQVNEVRVDFLQQVVASESVANWMSIRRRKQSRQFIQNYAVKPMHVDSKQFLLFPLPLFTRTNDINIMPPANQVLGQVKHVILSAAPERVKKKD